MNNRLNCKVEEVHYCSWLARALRRSSLAAAALPRMREEVGMVRVAPEAAVRPRPAAVVKLAAVMGSRRKTGWELVMANMQAATVSAIKPWQEKRIRMN